MNVSAIAAAKVVSAKRESKLHCRHDGHRISTTG